MALDSNILEAVISTFSCSLQSNERDNRCVNQSLKIWAPDRPDQGRMCYNVCFLRVPDRHRSSDPQADYSFHSRETPPQELLFLWLSR